MKNMIIQPFLEQRCPHLMQGRGWECYRQEDAQKEDLDKGMLFKGERGSHRCVG